MNNQLDIINDLDVTEIAYSTECEIQDLEKYIPIKSTDLSITSQNIRSIYSNLNDFMATMSLLDFESDILLLTECRLAPYKPIPHLVNYSSLATVNNLNQNDGVVAYVSNRLKANIQEIKLTHASCLQITVNNTLLLGIYRSPSNYDALNFIDSLDNYLYSVKSFKNIIITGDVNINLIPRQQEPAQENHNRNYYLNMLSSHGILPGHSLPTREATCLDHFMLKIERNIRTAHIAVLNTTVTDHLTIFLCLTNQILKDICPKKCIKIDYDKAMCKLFNKELISLLSSNDPGYVAERLICKLQESLEESKIIKSIPKCKRCIKPWVTPGILRCINNRNKMQLRVRSDPGNEILRATFKRYRNFCNKIIKHVKRKYDRELLSKSVKNTKALWKTIKSLTNYKTAKTKNIDLLNTAATPVDSVNLVNDFFSNIGKKLAEDILAGGPLDPISGFSGLSDSMGSSFVLLDTDPQEISDIILGLKVDSAPGWDNIPTRFLRLVRTEIAPVISHLANLCFATGAFPSLLKQSIVTPVHKTGESDDANNYRPISVLPAISKIIEKAINNRLITYLDKFNILSAKQFGFRRGTSTEDATIALTHVITDIIDKSNKCLAVFLDLKKAFDTVSLPILVRKLERIGIRGCALDLLSDYLHGRTQRVKIGDVVSREASVSYGVPQGSVLGPTLFLIYINDLTGLNVDCGHIFSYADDTVILFEGKTWEDTFTSADLGLRGVYSWLKNNLLTLNISKTNYICFSKYLSTQPHSDLEIKIHNNCNKTISSLNCNCMKIKRVPSTKYLGLILDQRLSWHSHVAHVNGRIRKLVWLFKILRHVSTKALLSQIYIALAQSVMSYCICVWGGATKTKFLEVERGQRCILKVMYFRPFRFPTSDLYRLCDLLSMRKLYILCTVLKRHRTLTFNPSQLNGRRNRPVAQFTYYKSIFARRQFSMQSSCLYNRINAKINIYPLTWYECKKTLTIWIKHLSYEDTEALLNHAA